MRPRNTEAHVPTDGGPQASATPSSKNRASNFAAGYANRKRKSFECVSNSSI